MLAVNICGTTKVIEQHLIVGITQGWSFKNMYLKVLVNLKNNLIYDVEKNEA